MQLQHFINRGSETTGRCGPNVCQEREFGFNPRMLKGSCMVEVVIIDSEYGARQQRMQVQAQLEQKGAKN
jgi:hypothetical protein